MAIPASRFFTEGEDCESGYRGVRDSPLLRPAREYTEMLWAAYGPFADRHFLLDAKKHFLQRYWEMYATVALQEKGLRPVRVGGTGPEFFFEFDRRRVWVEAIAPGSGDGKDRVPKNLSRRGFSVPTEQILLRYTSALTVKRDKLLQDRLKGIVSSNDAYVLALNCRGIPHAWMGGVIPFMRQAYLPFGRQALTFDRTGRITDRSFERRDSVSKKSGEAIPTTSFLNPEFSGISAVVHSAVNAANAPIVLGGDFLVLHNPLARYPLGTDLFSRWQQYVFSDDKIQVIEPSNLTR